MKIILPKVSCLIICDDIPYDLVENYKQQVYPNKELVVLTRNDFQQESYYGMLYKKVPKHINWEKDLAIELTTGEKLCWWEMHEPYYLSKRVKDEIEDEVFFSKVKFYEAQNMLYAGSKLGNGEYCEI